VSPTFCISLSSNLSIFAMSRFSFLFFWRVTQILWRLRAHNLSSYARAGNGRRSGVQTWFLRFSGSLHAWRKWKKPLIPGLVRLDGLELRAASIINCEYSRHLCAPTNL